MAILVLSQIIYLREENIGSHFVKLWSTIVKYSWGTSVWRAKKTEKEVGTKQLLNEQSVIIFDYL